MLAADRAPEFRLSTYTMDFSAVLWRYLDIGWHVDDAQRLHNHALSVARELGDRVAEGLALRALGLVNHRMDRYQEAVSYLESALALHEELGDVKMQATTLNYVGAAYHYVGRTDDAISYLERSIDLYAQLGDQFLQTKPLTNIGRIYQRLGEYERAFDYLQEAVAINQQFGEQVYNLWTTWTVWGIISTPEVNGLFDNALPDGEDGIGLAFAGRHDLVQAWCDGGSCD
jgi:tetratricopeptide (TPR) repeat protein